MFKKLSTIFLSFVVILGFIFSNSVNSYAYNQQKVKQCMEETATLMYKTIPEPTVSSIGGEWTVLSLARSGIKIPQKYYDDYYKRVEETLKACNGQLHKVKYTEYSRVILALTAINKDVTNVAGYNLLDYLTDLNNVKKQGINGPIFALIAYDCANYQIPENKNAKDQVTRQKLVDYILSKEINKGLSNAGGWALSGNNPDPDVTFMAIQALSKYTNQKEVKDAVDRALNVMSNSQLSTGGFGSYGVSNCESTAQAIVGLTALGVNIDSDPRFVKTDSNGNKTTLIDGLLHYYCQGGGFAHITGSGTGAGINSMAKDQGMYALVAYNRYINGKNSLYNMTDASTDFSTGDNSNLGENGGSSDNDKNQNNQNGNANQNQNSQSGKETSKKAEAENPDISITTTYTGEKDGLIPENKKCVIVQFKQKEKEEIVEVKLSKEEKQYLYYSQELSDKRNTPTYIGLFDTSVKKEDLLKMDSYEFHEIEKSKDKKEKAENIEEDYSKPEKYEIIFGDVNDDKVVNAQDILDVQSILSGKLDLVDEKQIIAINVSMDSKIDNADIDQIMNYFLSKVEYTILTIWDNKSKDEQTDKVSK